MPSALRVLLLEEDRQRDFGLAAEGKDTPPRCLDFTLRFTGGGEVRMAGNMIDEIKAAEERAAASVQEAKAAAVRKLNRAQAEAENAVKEARQSAARQFREKIQDAERAAKTRAKAIVDAREAEAKAFHAEHKGKVSSVASWITEEVMGRYGRG